jgi:hypothetical protein
MAKVCGFYPGLHPGQYRYGTASSFDQARAGFEAERPCCLRSPKARLRNIGTTEKRATK